MPTAEIITIGTELLLGETVDTNTRTIAQAFRHAGINLFRTATIGDNKERIAEIIQEAMERAEIIITTGGLGPTVDDPTREAIALAMGAENEFRPELWEQIQERFQRYGQTPTENNKRQAYVPSGALAIENDLGTAPAFIAETDRHAIIALPGVPREMEYLLEEKILPYLRERFDLRGMIKTRLLHTSGVGESTLDNQISDLERLGNPTVGLAAHAGQVDIRITAKADSEPEADALIQTVESDIRQRIGDWIYGADEDTLQSIALEAVARHGWKLAAAEANLGGRLLRRLTGANETFAGGELVSRLDSAEELAHLVQDACQKYDAQVGLGVTLIRGEKQQTIYLYLQTPDRKEEIERSYGGPPQLAPLWATNTGLHLLRNLK
jgi:competence/damage-inducible protein CinA-like protein